MTILIQFVVLLTILVSLFWCAVDATKVAYSCFLSDRYDNFVASVVTACLCVFSICYIVKISFF